MTFDPNSVTPQDPIELARKLGGDITNIAAGNGQPTPPVDNFTREKIDISRYPSVEDAVNKNTQDRSADTYGIIAACHDAGLSLGAARWVIDQSPDLAARVGTFLARNPPVDDVGNSWITISARNAWAQPAAGGSPPAPAAGAPIRFFSKNGGLLALDLAVAVMAQVICGYGDPDKRFYTYADGVWTMGENPVEKAIVALLGNRYRANYTKTITTIIKYQPGIRTITDEPLADYINVPNGMIHWDTGRLLPHNADYKSTVQLPVEYNLKATCPLFEKFIREVLPPDLVDPTPDSPGFIWELIGYTIFSGNPLHLAVLLFGKGRNGKGTLIRVIKALLGENNCSTVSLHELTENKFRAATLFRKLANLAGDLDSKWLENTALFKKITGADGIQGEYKFHDSFEFDPWALPFYSANKAFGSPDSSEGWVARWLVVPFPNTFLGREDRTLDETLTSELELRGILARAVDALPYLMARGNFAALASLNRAKQEFVLASDTVRAWLDENCVIEFGAWTPRLDLYRTYLQSTLIEGARHQLGKREFYNRVEQVQKIVISTRMGVRGFGGVRIKAVVS